MRTSIHFEGIPGSGKTTASKRFYKLLCSLKINATLYLEEASNHPIMPKENRTYSCEQDYPQDCLNKWLTLYKSFKGTGVFDGYCFQSTVRFLYANNVAAEKIEDYFNKWQVLAPETTLIYFSVDNPSKHYDVVLAERGDEWARKLYQYVESSPIGHAKSYSGRAGFIEFWANYQRLCYDLLDAAYVSVHILDSRSWDDEGMNLLTAKLGLSTERL